MRRRNTVQSHKKNSRGGNNGRVDDDGKPHTRSRQGYNPVKRVVQARIGQAGETPMSEVVLKKAEMKGQEVKGR